jgi:hypothetical protein
MKNTAVFLMSMVILVSAACSGSGGPTAPSPAPANPSPAPVPTPTPAPPSTTPFTRTLTGTVNSASTGDWLRKHEFVVPQDGAGTITLTWTNGSVDLDLALTDPSCAYNATLCAVYQTSAAFTGTTERISRTMKAGETFSIWVINYGYATQPYTIDLEVR